MKKIILAILLFNCCQLFSQSNKIYSGKYGYDAVAHYSDGVLYSGRYGYDALYHIEDNVVYYGRYGYDAVAHYEDGIVYSGRYGYDAMFHIEGQISIIQLMSLVMLYDDDYL